MVDRYQAWIEGAAAERPHLTVPLAALGDLYHRKLWHQLTEHLEQCIDLPEFQEDGFLVMLYHNFVSGFAHKINQLKLAFFAAAVSKHMASAEVGAAASLFCLSLLASHHVAQPKPGYALQEGFDFIQNVIDNLEASKQPDTEQPVLYLRMQLAQYALVQGRLQVQPSLQLVTTPLSSLASQVTQPLGLLQECKRAFEAGREELEMLTDVSSDPASPELAIPSCA
jgi:26S proteasome regulatory subunit N9